jgi:CheY-like chemotaxis protein
MKKILLVVEDDVLTAHLYKGSLERAGYDVQVALDGQAGLDLVSKVAPDAILLDLMMPKVNGIEVLKQIRSHARFRSMPVLVYTNAFVPKLIRDAKEAGASDVLDKAKLTPTLLLEILGLALKSQQP